MPSNPPRIYFDACVFLAYVSGEADRAPTIELLFEKSEAGEIDIVTSTTSITEVTYVLGEQEAEKLDPDIESKLDNLFGDVKTVVLAEFSSLVARDARTLIRESLVLPVNTLKPMDAIHLATAQRLRVQEFLTYDKKVLRHNGRFSFPVKEPFVSQHKLI